MVYKTKRNAPRNLAKLEQSAKLPRGAVSRAELLFSEPIEEKHLVTAISYLQHGMRTKKKAVKRHCVMKDPYCSSKTAFEDDSRICLRQRHASLMSEELRKAILLQDWDSAVKLLLLIIHTGIKTLNVLILKACLVILFNHPMATPQLLSDFVRNTTGYMVDADIEDFVLLIFTIRKTLLPVSKGGSYNFISKVTQDTIHTTTRMNLRDEDDPRMEQ